MAKVDLGKITGMGREILGDLMVGLLESILAPKEMRWGLYRYPREGAPRELLFAFVSRKAAHIALKERVEWDEETGFLDVEEMDKVVETGVDDETPMPDDDEVSPVGRPATEAEMVLLRARLGGVAGSMAAMDAYAEKRRMAYEAAIIMQGRPMTAGESDRWHLAYPPFIPASE